MTISEALYSKVTGTAAISNLIGTRFYPAGEAPAKVTYPYATYQRTTAAHSRHLGGGAGVASPRFDINVWGMSASSVEAVFEALRENLDNVHHATWGSTKIAAVFLDDDDAEDVPPDKADGGATHRRRLSFIIWHAETVTPV